MGGLEEFYLFPLKGIGPLVYIYKILLEDDYKPSKEHQRRLNPNMKEMVKKEVQNS